MENVIKISKDRHNVLLTERVHCKTLQEMNRWSHYISSSLASKIGFDIFFFGTVEKVVQEDIQMKNTREAAQAKSFQIGRERFIWITVTSFQDIDLPDKDNHPRWVANHWVRSKCWDISRTFSDKIRFSERLISTCCLLLPPGLLLFRTDKIQGCLQDFPADFHLFFIIFKVT